MNILFLSQRLPYPPKKGDKIRSFNELKFLSQKHQISLACLTDNERDFQYKKDLKRYCSSVDIVFLPSYRSKLRSFLYMFSGKPLTLSYFYSQTLQSIVYQTLKRKTYDLIFVYCSSMAQYVEHIQNIPRVIDFVDLDSEKWAQYAQYAKFPYKYLYRSESKRLKKYEKFVAETFHHCFFVSEKEVEDFQKLVCSCSTVTPLLNGVDSPLQPLQESSDSTSLVFTGTMDYWANVRTMLYLCREILPSIRKVVPDVKLYIVGRDPAPEILKLGKTDPNIIVTGYVDQIQPYLLKSAVFVAPMQIARGVQTKILEAMAMGVPVVTTSLGLEGITAVPGEDLFVEDPPEQFAKRVIQLMTDPELRKKISVNARKTIKERYNWDKNLEKLEDTLLKVANVRHEA
jgi:sugar transferase (PEP-CTERM/EpsH1 system associated)